ncbi:hypothetical protein Hanom_Chr16g01466291 [Helianthus anomalus]
MKTGTRVLAGIPQLIWLQDDVPTTSNGHTVRVLPQTQRRRRLWLISRNIGSQSCQTRYVLTDEVRHLDYRVDLMYDGV